MLAEWGQFDLKRSRKEGGRIWWTWLCIFERLWSGGRCQSEMSQRADLGWVGAGEKNCSKVGEGNGSPLQHSCLENPMDGRAWKAAVHGVAVGQTRLSNFTSTFHFHALEKEMATHSSVLAWRISSFIVSHLLGKVWWSLIRTGSGSWVVRKTPGQLKQWFVLKGS